jgi:hypothetical protein
MENFTDSPVTDYVNNLTNSELETLIDDLNDDFDSAISSRFNVSSSQSSTLSNSPTFFKTVLTTAFQNLNVIRSNNASVDFEISGLASTGSGSGLTADELIIEIGHKSDCTWYIRISITKS